MEFGLSRKDAFPNKSRLFALKNFVCVIIIIIVIFPPESS